MASQKKNEKKLKPFQEPLPHFVKLEKKKLNDDLSGSQSLTGTVTIYVGETPSPPHPQQKQLSRRKKKN